MSQRRRNCDCLHWRRWALRSVGVKTVLGLFFISLLTTACGWRASALSAAEVENNVLGGRQTIIDNERNLWQQMINCHNGNHYGSSNSHRYCVNITAYTNFMWIMAKNNNTNVVEVDAGAKEVKLRVKTLLFYNASVVSPVGGWDWFGYNDQRVVRADNFPNDRAPNFFVSDCGYLTTTGVNCPALTANYYQVSNAWVDANSSGAYVSYFDSGVKNSGVSKTTRYQFTPDQDMVIRSDSGFVANQDINVHIEYRRARHYYNQGWVVCDSGGSVARVSSVTYCPPNYASATIKVKVKAPVVEVTATVDNGSTKRLAQTKKDSLGNGSSRTEINGQSTWLSNGAQATTTNNRPGQQLTWWFSTYNKGPGPTLSSFDMMNMRTGWGNTEWDAPDFSDTNKVNWFQLKVNQGQTHKYGCYDWGKTCWYNGSNLNSSQATTRRFIYTIGSNDAGKTFCQRARVSWNEGTWREVVTPYACAYVPYHYPGRQGTNEPSNQFSDCTQTGTCPNTTPKGGIQLSTSVAGGQTTIMPGESVKFNYTLSNSGPTKSKGLTYRAYTFILKGGTGLPSNSNHMSTYPAGWQNVDCNSANVNSGNHGTCLMGKNGSGLVIDPSTPKSITSDSYTIANEWLGNPGDQICSYIAVDNNWSVYNDTPANSYAVSNVACVKIGKKPQIQINGSDSYAKNGFTGGNYTDIAINTNRGSYSQYGLLTGSNGSITNFGTAGYTNISNTNKTKACKLAYANTTGLTNTNCSLLGKAGINRTISIPTKMNAGNVVSTELNVGDVGAGGSNLGNAYYRANGDLEIHGTLKEGNRITVYVDGNITITDNIDTVNGESGRYDTLSQIPSLTLVAAGDIRISSNVTLVNANLVAMNGSLHTCYNATNEDLGLVSKCSNKLKINGAVISKNSPKLLRTFGSGNASNYTNQWDANTTSSTSEWFNYTPNSWLVPNVGSMNSAITGYNTASISDLPARY